MRTINRPVQPPDATVLPLFYTETKVGTVCTYSIENIKLFFNYLIYKKNFFYFLSAVFLFVSDDFPCINSRTAQFRSGGDHHTQDHYGTAYEL